MAGKETVYIVLFRGLGGATQLPTAPLREALTKAGFRHAATYINSGNALVVSELTEAEVTAKVAALVERHFGFTKEILVVSLAEWYRIVSGNPFARSWRAMPEPISPRPRNAMCGWLMRLFQS